MIRINKAGRAGSTLLAFSALLVTLTLPRSVHTTSYHPPVAATHRQASKMTPASPKSSLVNGPYSCDTPGGVKLYEYYGRTGYCAKFTGYGDLNVQHVLYPGSSTLYIGRNSGSMSTIGGTYSGILICAGGSFFTYYGEAGYNDLAGPDAKGRYPYCTNQVDVLQIK